MTTNDDGLLPGGNKARYVGANYGLSKHSSTQNVSNGTIWTLPHLFQMKLCIEIHIHKDFIKAIANLAITHMAGVNKF